MRGEATLVGLVVSAAAVTGAMAVAQREEPPSTQVLAASVSEATIRPIAPDQSGEMVTTTTTTLPPPPTTTTTTSPPPPPPLPKPVRATAASPPVPARVGACAGLDGAIAARWPADQVGKACRVMMCESGGNPAAQNSRSSASGLFQFLKSTWNGFAGYAEAWQAPVEVQLDAAHALWARSGWSPWVCR